MFKFNEAVSFFISVKTQDEVDYFWERLSASGTTCHDRPNLSLSQPQRDSCPPSAVSRCLHHSDRTKADRAMQAMMTMKKIVIADIEAAFAG